MRYLVHQLVEDGARRNPDDLAVIDRDRSLSYRQLDSRSNQLARLLAQHGVRRGDRVGLYLDKSAESVVAVYGAMKAGAAYVPLDPDAPVTRLAYIARDCGIRCLLTSFEKGERVGEMLREGAPLATLVFLNADSSDLQRDNVEVLGKGEVDASSPDPLSVDIIDQDLAYILYTSGSTGDPKGVMLTHRNAMAFISWAAEEFAVSPTDRLSSHAPLHFDLSVFDLYAAAYGGAAVVLVPSKTSLFPNQIVKFIADQKITIWYSVPSILSMVTLRGGLDKTALPTLHTVLFAGEVFPIKYLKDLMKLIPHARFANLYGPTETNVCTWYEVPRLDDNVTEPVPIGLAIANDEVFAMKEDGNLAQFGEVGELYVRGATVMRGYWGDPERTTRNLVPDPFGSTFSDPVYRTGDLVEAQPDGNYRYIGRRDSQIKSRGYRIELGDIEAALNRHPGVVECAVLAVPDDVITNRLVAYLAVRDDSTPEDLARYCAELLPRYMVPETLTLEAELPKTSTGKIDRRSLLTRAGG